jgi:CDGSH-type Zn-finger protein
MFVCGCKVSSQAPFCDGVACQKILKGEELEVQRNIGEDAQSDVEQFEVAEE